MEPRPAWEQYLTLAIELRDKLTRRPPELAVLRAQIKALVQAIESGRYELVPTIYANYAELLRARIAELEELELPPPPQGNEIKENAPTR